jgi:hypothetical protein
VEYDRRIEQIAKEIHPQVALLKQVKGVGTLIALTYVLTPDDPHRFRRLAMRGALLVQGAHYILGPFGEDSVDARRLLAAY